MDDGGDPNVLILIPAAGASSRMRGRDKLLEPIGHVPLLARQVARALETGAQVLVTVAQDRPKRVEALAGLMQDRLNVQIIEAREGMAVSIRAGAALAIKRGAEALMIVLPDMPEIETDDMNILIAAQAAAPDSAQRATTAEGTPGHPVLFPRRLFAKLDSVTGDTGAREVLQGEQVRPTPLCGNRAVTDLDTPEDWARWQCLFR